LDRIDKSWPRDVAHVMILGLEIYLLLGPPCHRLFMTSTPLRHQLLCVQLLLLWLPHMTGKPISADNFSVFTKHQDQQLEKPTLAQLLANRMAQDRGSTGAAKSFRILIAIKEN